ncbi:MAG: hypothetical protein IT537_20160 [Hyphomicrobiales bacterium]|nr:hypothetical protein [Hyphomicrobiales bacterium]
MSDHRGFRRVILGLHHNVSRQELRLAAEVAALLRVELHGLLVKEDELAGLAALPFAREFRPLEGAWHAFDLERLALDLDVAAERAQRSFAEAARSLGLTCQFEVVRGSMAHAIASISRAGDVVVISEPASPAERITVQFQSMVTAALGSAAAVMVMPPRAVRRHGPVVAIMAAPGDESAEVAAAIAALAGEELVVIDTSGRRRNPDLAMMSRERNHRPGQLAGRDPARDRERSEPVFRSDHVQPPRRRSADDPVTPDHTLAALATALRPQQERLLVLTRGTLDNPALARLASTRGVPVLVIEPEKLVSEG